MIAADDPVSGEQQLIHDAMAGNDRAFQTLVESHMKQIYNVAFGFAGDHDAAEDITQEVFVRAHSRLASFRGEAGFGTWLYRIALNVSLNDRHQRKRRAERSVRLTEGTAVNIASYDDHVENADQRAFVERALHELPTLQRAVLILRHLEGLSTRQVSEILKCSEGTVKTHLFRGLKKMRRKLLFLQEGHG